MIADKMKADAVVIGGGFYGASIAIYLAKNRGLKKVVLVEKEKKLLTRASYNNQARVHNGYHYPRSFTTAFRSRCNLPRFIKDWPQAVKQDFTKIYAIAKNNSKVTARQFERFCDKIGAYIAPAPADVKKLFNPQLVEDSFLVHEYAFDATKLAGWAVEELKRQGVEVYYSTEALSVARDDHDNRLVLTVKQADQPASVITSRYIFNCTYSGLNQLTGDFTGTETGLKHEVTEMALIELPDELENLGITVMDGPFFSIMPFPARGLHTLSHVRYTPHFDWLDKQGTNPYKILAQYDKATQVDRMIRDAARYIPAVRDAKYVDSLFEVKTILIKNDTDDGRPILFEKNNKLKGFYSILGGKIDNIYDVLEKLETEDFSNL